jgi:hypothetical protein
MLKWLSTFYAFGTDRRLNGVTFLAFNNELRSAVLAVIAEERWLSAFRATNLK